MKNRKRIIATLACMSLTSQMLPSAYTIVANAQTTTANAQTTTAVEQNKTGLSKTVIKLYGVGCEEGAGEIKKPIRNHEFQITFNDTDPDHIKIIPNVITGYPNTQHPFQPYFNTEYISISLLNCNGKIKKTVSLAGYDNISKLKNELEGWEFHYGDSLRIHHDESKSRLKIDEDKKPMTLNPISNDEPNTYDFQITRDGLKQIEQKTVKKVNNADELIKQLNELKGTGGIIELQRNITFNNAVKLEVPEGISIYGANHEIDLGGKASLVLKGNFTGLSSVTVKNSPTDGVQVYNSIYSYIKNVVIEGSKGSGLLVNGSDVTLDNCTTRNNTKGGVTICKSLSLEISAQKTGKKSIDSKVTVVGGLKSEERQCLPDVVVKNLKIENTGKFQVNQKASFIRYQGNDLGGEQPGYIPAQVYKDEVDLNHTKLNKSYYNSSLGLDENTKVLETYTMYKLNK